MKYIAYILLVTMVLASCSSIECSLNHLVSTHYAFWSETDGVQTLHDTLSISIRKRDGRDSVLLNRGVEISNFSLPMSYAGDADTLYFRFTPTGSEKSICDTILVEKTNTPHFESVECEPNYFHTITRVGYTHHYIKSVAINNTAVEYETTTPHILLTLPADK